MQHLCCHPQPLPSAILRVRHGCPYAVSHGKRLQFRAALVRVHASSEPEAVKHEEHAESQSDKDPKPVTHKPSENKKDAVLEGLGWGTREERGIGLPVYIAAAFGLALSFFVARGAGEFAASRASVAPPRSVYVPIRTPGQPQPPPERGVHPSEEQPPPSTSTPEREVEADRRNGGAQARRAEQRTETQHGEKTQDVNGVSKQAKEGSRQQGQRDGEERESAAKDTNSQQAVGHVQQQWKPSTDEPKPPPKNVPATQDGVGEEGNGASQRSGRHDEDQDPVSQRTERRDEDQSAASQRIERGWDDSNGADQRSAGTPGAHAEKSEARGGDLKDARPSAAAPTEQEGGFVAPQERSMLDAGSRWGREEERDEERDRANDEDVAAQWGDEEAEQAWDALEAPQPTQPPQVAVEPPASAVAAEEVRALTRDDSAVALRGRAAVAARAARAASEAAQMAASYSAAASNAASQAASSASHAMAAAGRARAALEARSEHDIAAAVERAEAALARAQQAEADAAASAAAATAHQTVADEQEQFAETAAHVPEEEEKAEDTQQPSALSWEWWSSAFRDAWDTATSSWSRLLSWLSGLWASFVNWTSLLGVYVSKFVKNLFSSVGSKKG